MRLSVSLKMWESKLSSMQLLYSRANGQVSVYRAWDEVRQKRVCIKEQRCVTIREFNRRLQEGMNQSSLTHFGICKLYECYLKQDHTQLFYVIEMELMEHDLEKEIHTRSETGTRWSERELKQIVFVLVDALAYAQEHEICHRDISPQNIFVSRNGSVKLGDFGSSTRTVDDEDEIASMSTSNPVYLSPAHKRQPGLHSNSYKSDVYALGVSLLTMAHLSEPTTLSGLIDLEAHIREAVDSVPYSEELRSLVRHMLEIDEEKRFDFIELRRLMMSLFQIQETSLAERMINKCLGCHIRILPGEEASQVQLTCEKTHVFCGQACFRQYLERSAVLMESMESAVCPKKKCRKPVEKRLMRELFLSVQSYELHKVASQVETCEVPKLQVEQGKTVLARTCCACLSPVRMQAIEATFRQFASDETVSLPCDQNAHVFCRPECLRDYVKTQTKNFRKKIDVVGCPLCARQIPHEVIYKAFGGRGGFQYEVERTQTKWMGCRLCHRRIVELMLPCGHCFCLTCLYRECDYLRMQGCTSLLCMVCHRKVYDPPSFYEFCKIT